MFAFLRFLRRLFGLEFLGDPFVESIDLDGSSALTFVPAQNGNVVQLAFPSQKQKTRKKQKLKQSHFLSLVLLSDTHLRHNEIDVPSADVLIHAGDVGVWNASIADLKQVDAWIGSLPHAVKIVIAGNHDKFDADTLRATFQHATFLHNESAFIELRSDGSVSVAHQQSDDSDVCARLKVHGHPQTHARSFVYRANAFSASLEQRNALCAQIDDDVNILVTHPPPFGILDLVGSDKHEGCAAVRKRVDEIKPLLHVFGHCHGHGGRCVQSASGTTFINAAQEIATPIQVRISFE